MKKLLLSCMLFLMAMMTNAQLAINYPLTVSNGTYSSISGTGTNIPAMTADNNQQNLTALPGFTVNGTTYTNARVSSNGWLILYGATAPTSTQEGSILSTSVTNGAVILAPMNADLNVSTVATAAFYYQTIGNENIFEWKNYSRYNLSGGNDVLNFQIRMNTVTGEISYVYGTCTQGSNPTSSFQIGWKTNGATASNWTTDINNLMINTTGSPNTCTWENAVTGNANDSNMYFNSANTAVAPTSGLTYTWAPPAVAVAPVRTFAAVSAITDTGATLSWTAPTGATQYNLRYRTVGSCSWTNWSGNPVSSNSATLTGLAPETSYQIQVQASDGANNSIWSHIPTSGSGSGTNGYVAAGTFKTLQPACTGTPSAGSISGATIRPTCGGSTPSPSTVTVTGQSTGVSGITFQWEKSTDNTTWTNATGTGNATITYTVPAHVIGQTEYYRLKAICAASALFAYSDVLQITDPSAPITQATNVGTSALGNTTATVTWNSGSGNRRFVKINTTNSFTDPVNGSSAALSATAAYSGSGEQIVYDGTGTSVNVTGLSANTTYYVRVYEYQRCGSSSPYSFYYQTATGTNNPGSFTTALYCVPANPTDGCSGDNVTSVVLEALSDTGLTCTPYYEDRTASQNAIPQLTGALSFPMSVGVGNGGTEHVGVWIDYNQNGTFEASEYTALGSGNNTTVTGNISVPATALAGNTKMRVRSKYSAALAGTDACATVGYGTTRDYAVGITPAPACTGTPIAGAISGTTIRKICGGSTPSPGTVTVTGQTASVSGITNQWEVSTDNATWANATGTTATTDTYTIPAHTTGQIEYYRLKATCTASGLFGYSDVLQVTDPDAPATAATNVSTSALGNTTATVTWTNGNGNRRFVKINTINSFTDPVNGSGAALSATTAYSGSGEQIVYDGTGTSVSITGLSPVTTYYVRVYEYQRCSSSAPYSYYYQIATGVNNPGNFITDLYCTPTGAANNSDEIRKFTLSNLNNSSAASEGVSGYSNYSTTVAPAVLEIGLPYIASLTSGSGSGTHGAAIWIDYNADGIFATNERVAVIASTIAASTTVSFPDFTVPSTVTPGTYRLRVMYRHNADGSSLDACTASTYSEIEDYAVNIVTGNLATNETQVTKSDIKVYPNPFSDVLNISDVDKVKTISIMDTSGRMVKSFEKAEAQLRLSDLSSGMYIVILNMKDGSKQTIKAIKK